ncbi:MAG TPA: DUF1622 domain-containing protein [Novimethylophilus sp.]|jgi:uncharacterized membrane protein|uniref:DUF1622 domain-containing protein n=1 Tax=Novimethylophilus sp. TaxID=2137426 RepID=UPI002F423226
MHELLVQWVSYVVPVIEAVGVVIVLWGVFQGFAGLACRAWTALRRHPLPGSLDDIRILISEKLVLGLEFFLAGDVIQTIVVPSWQSLGVLGGIVGIRTVIVYFLDKEMQMGKRAPDARR